jgi:signal transduction histidine kinase
MKGSRVLKNIYRFPHGNLNISRQADVAAKRRESTENHVLWRLNMSDKSGVHSQEQLHREGRTEPENSPPAGRVRLQPLVQGDLSGLSSDELAAEEIVRARLVEKKADYAKYAFTLHESGILNILFDLMQEFHLPSLLGHLATLLIKRTCGLDAEFYSRVVEDGQDKFVLSTRPVAGKAAGRSGGSPALDARQPREAGSEAACGRVPEAGVRIPVRGRYVGIVQGEEDREILGLLVLYPEQPLDGHGLLFFEKFANRLGFAMHNYTLAQKDSEHLEFVRNLVKDIGHNVLGPNMYFKLLINKLGSELIAFGKGLDNERDAPEVVLQKAKAGHPALLDLLNEIKQHFSHSSLFLESLLRESHFAHGRYVLRTTPLNLGERVVRAQYQSFLPLYKAKGIEAALNIGDGAGGEVDADFGLISQVVANIFSNALKYATVTPEVSAPFMRCTVRGQAEVKPAGRTSGGGKLKPGIRVEVLTSGEHIKPEEADRVFEKYFRASNTADIAGTGKGLSFVLDIVSRHKGEAGYKADPEGNLFYFALPLHEEGIE